MVYTSFSRPDGDFNASNFVIRRLIRIYPIYLVYAALYLYFYYAFAGGKILTPSELLGAVTLFPGYSAGIIGPGWTLAFEMYFYLCFSIAMIFGLTRGLLALTMFFLAAIGSRVLLNANQPTIYVLINPLLVEFLAGAWIGYALVHSTRTSDKFANLMLALSLVAFMAGIVFGYDRLPALMTWGVPSALLIAGLVFREQNGHVSPAVKHFSFMGDSSYSLYLIHIVLIDSVIFFAIHANSTIATEAISIGTFWWVVISLVIAAYCIAIAYFLYVFVERKLVKSLQQLLRKKRTATSAS